MKRSDLAQQIALILGTTPDAVTLYFNGRVGLYSILKSFGIGPGDEVILSAYTCVVVPNAIKYLGATPVYVDISLKDFAFIPEKVSALCSTRTKAIHCQNTYGLSAHIDILSSYGRSKGIAVVEDCTHGFGGSYKGRVNGTLTDFAYFSSQWNKPFSTGVGGYVVANDKINAARLNAFCDSLRQPSLKTKAMLWMLLRVRPMINQTTYYSFVEAFRWLSKRNFVPGSSTGEELAGTEMPENYLLGMSPLQKRAAQKALERLPAVNALRKANGAVYTKMLADAHLNHVAPELHRDHLFLKYPVLVHDRDAFMRKAREAQVALGDWGHSVDIKQSPQGRTEYVWIHTDPAGTGRPGHPYWP